MGNHECGHLMGMFRCTHFIGNKRCAQLTQKMFPWEVCMMVVVPNGKSQEKIILQNVAYWCAQQQSILGVPWEINGVYIVVGINNMGLNAP